MRIEVPYQFGPQLHRGSASRAPLLRGRLVLGFAALGLLLGLWSLWVGYEAASSPNMPVAEPYARFYVAVLEPWWKETHTPVRYEEHPVIDLMTRERIGIETVPLYGLLHIGDVFRWAVIPASVMTWGLIGLAPGLVYGALLRILVVFRAFR